MVTAAANTARRHRGIAVEEQAPEPSRGDPARPAPGAVGTGVGVPGPPYGPLTVAPTRMAPCRTPGRWTSASSTLQALELEPSRLIGRAGLAKIAEAPEDDFPDPEYASDELPVPQDNRAAGPRWSLQAAQDWVERYRRTHRPKALLVETNHPRSPQERQERKGAPAVPQ